MITDFNLGAANVNLLNQPGASLTLPIAGPFITTSNDPVPLVSGATITSTGLSPADLAAIQADLYKLPGPMVGPSAFDVSGGFVTPLLSAPGSLTPDIFTQIGNFISNNIMLIGVVIGGVLLFGGKRR